MATLRTEADGLYGSGLVRDGAGAPLRPGGLALTGRLLEHAGFARGARIVDVGCGQGGSVALMGRHGLCAFGVDAAAEPLAPARCRGNGLIRGLIRAGADRLPLRDRSVDGVLSECCLSVLPDRTRALAEWARVLRPAGILALSDVYSRRRDDEGMDDEGAANERADDEGPAGAAGCAALATRRALLDSVAAAGLRVERFEDCSEVLKAWVARFVFQYGSLEALWGGTCRLSGAAARRAVPGYCLLIARKPASAGPDLTDEEENR